MVTYLANAACVKVPVGPADGHRAARIITRGAVIPDGVEESKLKELLKLGLIVEQKNSADKPLNKRTVDELKAYAAENSIDLGDATKRDEILAAIAAAEAEPTDTDAANGADS